MSGALRLRPATQADAQLLFDWANEPEVRAQSFQEAPIAWETHCAWLAGVLADPGARLYIMLEDTEPVGQVRLQQQPSGAWRISYSIERSHRGQGYGKAILKYLADIAIERHCGRMEWICLDWNAPSLAFYRSIGAIPMDEWTVQRMNEETVKRFVTE